jgi:hypothetical protein
LPLLQVSCRHRERTKFLLSSRTPQVSPNIANAASSAVIVNAASFAVILNAVKDPEEFRRPNRPNLSTRIFTVVALGD